MTTLQFILYIISQEIKLKPNDLQLLKESWAEIIKHQTKPKIFTKILGFSDDQTNKLLTRLTSVAKSKIESELSQHQVRVTSLFDIEYPQILKDIHDPPLLLYYRGNLNLLDNNLGIAMVGSRRMSSYGKQVCEKFIGEMANLSINIISGLAFGVDSQCHAQALKQNLATTAVLGSGLANDSIYPRANYELAQQILKNDGLLISEYPPLAPALKHQFIARNRIIAGLASSTIIIEAAEKSGSLFTADFALEAGRDVFAVPGHIFWPNSMGPHKLISQGASLLANTQELIEKYGLKNQMPKTPIKFSELQVRVLECIQQEPQSLEVILETINLPIEQLLVIISELQLLDAITEVSPQIYGRK